MTHRKRDGATLALVIILAFVLIIVGGCFFVWQLLIGGGKELQHATDSGNLNVAKQALITPDVTVPSGTSALTGTDLRIEFDGLLTSDHKVNLLNFNRLVAKAVLVQLNAKAEGTSLAAANAAQLTRAVYELGSQLQSNLVASSQMRSKFESISNANSVRMLQHPTDTAATNAVSHRDSEYATSFMARNKASNVFINANQLPGGDISILDDDLISKDVGGSSKKFLIGYKGLSSSSGLNGVPTTWAVPLRPGEQPHLVSVDDFTANQSTPANLPATTIPNSFRSGGSAAFIRTGTDVQLRSCAVVGVLEQVFPFQMPGGTIIVDNAGMNISAQTFDDPGSSIFAEPGKMMQPAGVEIFTLKLNSGKFSDGTSEHKYMCHTVDGSKPSLKIISQANSPQDGPVSGGDPADTARLFPSGDVPTGEDLFAMKMHGQQRYKSQFDMRNTIMGTTNAPQAVGQTVGGVATQITPGETICNNKSFEGGGGAANPADCGNSSALAKLFNGDVGDPPGGSQSSYTNLMKLEQYILAIKAGFGGDAGCALVPGLGPVGGCGNTFFGSGMKHVFDGADLPFQPGTFQQILDDTDGNQFKSDLLTRIQQIAPGKDGSSIFGQELPYNKILFIHRDGNGNVVMDENKPSTLQYTYTADQENRPVIAPPLNIPDGNSPPVGRKPLRVSGRWVEGFMWECGGGQGSGTSASISKWYPSSGKGGLLGILRFSNCPEANGDDWCCP